MMHLIRLIYCILIVISLLYPSFNPTFHHVNAFSLPSSLAPCLHNGDQIPAGPLELQTPNQQSMSLFKETSWSMNPVLLIIYSPFDPYAELLWSHKDQLQRAIDKYSTVLNFSVAIMSYGRSVTNVVIKHEAHLIDVYDIRTSFGAIQSNQSIVFVGSHPLEDTDWLGSRFLSCPSVQSAPKLLIRVSNFESIVDHVALQEIPSNHSIKSFASSTFKHEHKIVFDLEKLSCGGPTKASLNRNDSTFVPSDTPFILLVEMGSCHWTVQHSYAISVGASGMLVHPRKDARDHSISQLHCDLICSRLISPLSLHRLLPVAMVSYEDGWMLFDGSLDKIGLTVSFDYQTVGPTVVVVDRNRRIHALQPPATSSSTTHVIDHSFQQLQYLEKQRDIDHHVLQHTAVHWPLLKNERLNNNRSSIQVEAALPSMREWLSLQRNAAEVLVQVSCEPHSVCDLDDTAVLRILVVDSELPLVEIARVHVSQLQMHSTTGGFRGLVSITALMPAISCTRDICDSMIELRLASHSRNKLVVTVSLILTNNPSIIVTSNAESHNLISFPVITLPVIFHNLTSTHRAIPITTFQPITLHGEIDFRTLDPSLLTSIDSHISQIRLVTLVSLHGTIAKQNVVQQMSVDGVVQQNLPVALSISDVESHGHVTMPHIITLPLNQINLDTPVAVTYQLSFPTNVPTKRFATDDSFVLLSAALNVDLWLPNEVKRPLPWPRLIARARQLLLPLTIALLAFCVCVLLFHARFTRSLQRSFYTSSNNRRQSYKPLSLIDEDESSSESFGWSSSPRSPSPRDESPRSRSPHKQSALSFRRWPSATRAFSGVHVLSPVVEALSECSPVLTGGIPSEMPSNFLAVLDAAEGSDHN